MNNEETKSSSIGQSMKESIVPDSREMNLSDFALFLSVMKNREAYEAVLSIIMEEEDLELAQVKVEEVVLNKDGRRAIRLDAWALDKKNRQFNTEMQNSAEQDDVRKRARYYQGLIDSPILKAGRHTKYKNLPSTVIIFITQDDIFGKDLAKYTFEEQCREVPGLSLMDGTKKIFLNMKSKNGNAELVSLLQYMKNTKMDNPDILVKDKRIKKLDEVVTEVRQSEEWEAVRMNILEIGLAKGEEIGKEIGQEVGAEKKLIKMVCKKLQKGKSPEDISEDLEESLETVKRICAAAVDFAPQYDCEKIYQALHK